MRVMFYQIGNTNTEIRRIQIDMLEFKSKITEIKISLEGFNRFEQKEGRISDLKRQVN